MNTARFQLSLTLCLATAALLGAGCAPRMTVATGTTIGLHANPGDLQSQPPQVTFGYKRAELALVPTGAKAAQRNGCGQPTGDAYSSLAIIDFQTKFFGETKLDQFIATGHASRDIQQGDSEFTRALAQGGDVQDELIEKHIYEALKKKRDVRGDQQAALLVRELDALGELEPGHYDYIESGPPANPNKVQKPGARPAAPDYDSFVTYRAHLESSIANLKSAATIKVDRPGAATLTLTGDPLKQAVANYEDALKALQQEVATQGSIRRALGYYMQTITR